MKKFFAAIALAVSLPFLAAPAQADEQAEMLAAATAYVDSPSVQNMIDTMWSAESMVQQVKTMMPNLPAETLKVVGQIASEELAVIRPAMRDAMIKSAASTYTLAEIKALNEFISTPVGASAMAKAQPSFAKTMEAMGPDMIAMQQRIGQRFSAYVQQQKAKKAQQGQQGQQGSGQ